MLLLLDGDVYCYLACKQRYNPREPKPKFTPEQDQEYLEESWENLKQAIDETMSACFGDSYLMAVKSDENYRDAMYPIWFDENCKAHGYKANRCKCPYNIPESLERLEVELKEQNVEQSEIEMRVSSLEERLNAMVTAYEAEQDSINFVKALRQRLVDEGMAVEAVGREADDLLQMWAVQAEEAGDPYVVATVDKDMKCIGGKFYNPKKKTIEHVEKEDGQRFFYEQLLMGDPVDSIPGIPGIGPVKAKKLLSTCVDEDELRFQVMQLYEDNFDDDWRDQLLSNGKLLYLQHHEHDFFTLEGW